MTSRIKNIIENQFQTLGNFLNNQKTSDVINEVYVQKLLSESSKLGVSLGNVSGGFTSLNQEVDDVVSSVPQSTPPQVVGRLPIGQLTDKVPEVKGQLKQSVPSANDLQLITQSSNATASGLLDVVISLGTPEAIAASVKKTVPSVSNQSLNTISEQVVDLENPVLQNFTDIDDLTIFSTQSLKQSLHKAIGGVTNVRGSIDKIKQTLFGTVGGDVTKLLNNANKGFSSLGENVVEDILSPARAIINSLAVKNGVQQVVSDSDFKTIITFSTNQQYNQALKIVRKYSDKSDDEIINKLKTIDNKISTVSATPTSGVTISARNLGSVENSWRDVNTPSNTFTTINFKEELIADLLSAKREITEIVVHHTFTGLNQNLGSAELQEIYKSTFNVGLPYHYLFTREGNIQRGRPINVETVPFINNHHKYSIHVAFVGGLNIPTKTAYLPDIEKHLSVRSLTIAQWKAFDTLLESAFVAYPGVQVLGHNEIDQAAFDPNFIPSDYVSAKYHRESLFTDSRSQQPFTRQQLIERESKR